jgi:hypothetical protein
MIVNPLMSHWLRVSMLLLVATPVIAFAVAFTSDVDFMIAAFFTMWVWVFVCVILAVIALAGLVGRLLGRGIRALRR